MRRVALFFVLMACVAHLALGEPPKTNEFFAWSQVAPGVLVADAPSQTAIGRSVLIIGPDASLLIDTTTSGLGAQLRREAQARGSKITHVINTSGVDHATGGNHAFREATILAHEQAAEMIKKQTNRYIAQIKEAIIAIKHHPREELQDLRHEIGELHKQFSTLTPERFLPTKTITKPMDLDWTGPMIRLIPVGPASTAGDLIVHLPEANVLMVGSLVWPGVHPVINRDHGASVKGWQAALEQAIAVCDDKTRVIASTGVLASPPTPTTTGGIELLNHQADYFAKLRRIVIYAKDVESMPRNDVVALTTGAFDGLGEPSRLKRNLGAMFDELVEASHALDARNEGASTPAKPTK